MSALQPVVARSVEYSKASPGARFKKERTTCTLACGCTKAYLGNDCGPKRSRCLLGHPVKAGRRLVLPLLPRPASSWTDCSKRMPAEGAPVLLLLENKDVVVAHRCAAWETGFFTSRALRRRGQRGFPMRRLQKLNSPAVRWREFGELPEPIGGLIARELGRQGAKP